VSLKAVVEEEKQRVEGKAEYARDKRNRLEMFRQEMERIKIEADA
jgi:hypothetical protein